MNILKKSIVLFLIIVMSSGCSAQKNDGVVKISGTIKNPIPQGEIILEKFEVGQTATVKKVNANTDGTFEMEAAVTEPGFYRINVYGQQFEILVLDDKDITITADGQGGQNIEATGSEDLERLDEVQSYMEEYSYVVRDFNQRYSQAQASGNQQKMDDLFDEGMNLEAEKINKLKKMAWKMDDSIVPLMITDYISDKSAEYAFLDSLGQKLQKELPNSSQVELFVNNLQYFKPVVKIGDVAPDITLPTPSGQTISLSDLRGKYVLLDFWAAWCGPCRKENPNVVAMYNKYNKDGFEVFSVSLDRTRDKWVQAIEQDGLIWPSHVSDLKYFQSAAAMTYKVDAIPYALLLDPEGRVIGKNLRGRQLQTKLASLFEK